MAVFSGPKIPDDGLVFYIDAAHKKTISSLGNNSFNSAPQLIRNIVSPQDTINAFNGVHIGNLDYYTVFAIDFPEGNFGGTGTGAGRHGITAGLDVRSGGKLYTYSRALHFHVYNNDTNSWLPTSFFNGLREGGHCYDSWSGNASRFTELTKFENDYNNIKNLFKNITVVLAGSHRDSTHTQEKLNIMFDLGAPSNIGSILDADPEWILVGKPGLGVNNYYGWAFENHSVDPTRVAHLNFGLPIFGTKDNHLSFDGVDDFINLPNSLGYTTEFTATAWFKHRGTPGGGYHIIFGGSHLEVSINSTGFLRLGVETSNGRSVSNFGSGLTDGNWHFVSFVYTGSNRKAYIDGNYIGQASVSGTLVNSFSNRNIGRFGSDPSYWLNGDLGSASIYNRALTDQEIKQKFEALRGRFGI